MLLALLLALPIGLPAPQDAAEARARAVAEATDALSEARQVSRTDRAAARAAVERGIAALAAEGAPELDPAAADLLLELGSAAQSLGHVQAAKDAAAACLAQLESSPAADAKLLREARVQLAIALKTQGDHPGALALEERVHAELAAERPEDDLELLRARGNLARTLQLSGQLDRARELQEQVLAVYERISPEGRETAFARINLAVTAKAEGDLERARELEERVLADFERTLPEQSRELQIARLNLGVTLHDLGELDRALELKEAAVAAFETSLPPEHKDLQLARMNLAVTLKRLGEPERARAIEESVVDALARTLPAGHADLCRAQMNLATSRLALGDLAGARALYETALAGLERALPPTSLDVLRAQSNVGTVTRAQGDFLAARAIHERALERLQDQLDPGHPFLLAALMNAGIARFDVGDTTGALEVFERILVARAHEPETSSELQQARSNVASCLKLLGRGAEARALEERVLAASEATCEPGSRELQRVRIKLASTLAFLGEEGRAHELLEAAVAALEPSVPADDLILLNARKLLAGSSLRLADEGGARAQAWGLLRGLSTTSRRLVAASPRERVEIAAALDEPLSALIFLAARPAAEPDPDDGLGRAAFELVEDFRSLAASGDRSAELRADAALAEPFRAARDARAELAAAAARSAAPADVAEAARRRDEAERALAAAAVEQGLVEPPFDLARFARSLPEGSRAIAYRTYYRWAADSADETTALLAHVVAPDGSLARVELGPLAAVEDAVVAWRSSIGTPLVPRGSAASGPSPAPAEDARAAGERLRRLVLDPVLATPLFQGADVRSLTVCLDGPLHLVPLDALPAGAGVLGDALPSGEGVLGDALGVRVEVSLAARSPSDAKAPSEPVLVALGGVDYDAEPTERAPLLAQAAPPLSPGSALRGSEGGAWRGLPGTKAEVAAIGERFAGSFGREPVLLAEGRATKSSLLELGERARFLHIATHGWFAPESVASAGARTGRADAFSTEEAIQGFAPMTLCGLALAGANRGADALGRVGGILTAEELASFDLSGCELAVLSACETNVGVQRAGLGVQSLQAALHAAGARAAITSLWKVDDERTRELFEDFYARIWTAREPVAEALWNAKRALRAKGCAPRDWAAWVLSGSAD